MLSYTAASATPTITVGALTPPNSFTTTQGTASTAKTYTLAGSNLTANLTVGPLAGYEFSIDNFATAGLASLSLAPSSGSVSETVFVRLTAAAAIGTYNGNIANASTGATTQEVAVIGEVLGAATVPTLTTTTATAITASSASSGGDISSNGGAAVEARGVVYATTPAPRIGDVGVIDLPDAAGGSGTFTSSLTGLAASTTYYVAAYAINSVGTAYGTDESFTTLAPATAPTGVSTAAVTAITATAATSGGDVATDGGSAITGRGVVFATTTNPQIGDAGVTQVMAAGTTGPFTSSLTGLAPSTTYYVAAYATNGVSTTYGADQSFTTAAAPAAPLLAFDFEGTNANPTVGSSINAANVNPSVFSRVMVTPNAGANRFNSAGWSTSIDLTKYIQFAFAPATGFQASLTSLGFTDQRSGSATTNPYEVRSSLDNYAAAIASGVTTGGSKTVLLTGFSAIQSTGVTFRFYYGVSALTSTYSVDNVQLFGTVTPAAAGPEIDVTQGGTSIASGGSFAFASILAGGTADETFTIVNSGTAALAVSAISLANNAGGDFSLVPPPSLPASVAVGANLPLQVRFAPTTAGPKTATLTIVSDDANEGTYTITLTGNALAPEPVAPQPTVAVSGITLNSVELTLAGGTGAKRLVVLRPTAAAAVAPVDGTTYTPSLSYESADPAGRTGPNNFVVVASATAGPVVVTGLSNNIAYTVEVYAYNDNNTSGAENYLTLAPGTASFTTLAAPVTIYTWNGTGTSYVAPTSWTPSRTTPGPNDALVFDGAAGTPATATVTLDYSASETIAQLFVRNGVAVTLSTDANRTLALDGNAGGADFVIDATSSLTLSNSNATTATGIVLSLAALETAAISGRLVYGSSTTSSGRHSLISAAANSNAIEFLADSRLVASPLFDGSGNNSAFGTTTGASGAAFSVIFRDGATYEHTGGSNPFGLSAPNAFVTFEPNSSYLFNAATGQPSLSNRTYGNMEYNTASTTVNNSTGGSLLTIRGNLTVTRGNVVFLLTGGVNIGGNIVVNTSLGSLSLAPSSTTAPPIQLNGTSAQTIGGDSPAGTLSFGPNAILQVNNAAGVTLLRPVTLSKELRLTNGIVTTSVAGLLTLNTNALTAGSATSFVSGPLARATETGVATVVFPIGKGTAYRPLTLTTATQTNTPTYTAEQFETKPSTSALTGGLTRVSAQRYFSLTPTEAPTGYSGTLTITFDIDDFVNNPADASFVMAKRSTSASDWENIGRSVSTGNANGGQPVAGTLTSGSFTSFSDFALASTNANTEVNPLPVELSSFTARRQGSSAVLLNWTTASEQNSAHFDVQRSLDGRKYTTIAHVQAQGNSSRLSSYASLDGAAPAGTIYYRLFQADVDGKTSYSPVLTVSGGAIATKVLLYPNPAHSSISFAANAATPYRVLNQLGQPLLRGTTEAGTAKVTIDALAPGLYFLELQTATGRVVQKFEKD